MKGDFHEIKSGYRNEIVEPAHTFERLGSYLSYFGGVGPDIKANNLTG